MDAAKPAPCCNQALNVECDENELERLHKAVFLLAYLSGMEGREAEVERLKEDLSKAQAEAEQWKSEAINWKSWAKYYQDAGNSVTHLEERLHEAEERAQNAERRAEDAEAEAAAWRPENEPESRDDAIRTYFEAGNSYQKTADKFGLSKTQVYRIINGEGGQ